MGRGDSLTSWLFLLWCKLLSDSRVQKYCEQPRFKYYTKTTTQGGDMQLKPLTAPHSYSTPSTLPDSSVPHSKAEQQHPHHKMQQGLLLAATAMNWEA